VDAKKPTLLSPAGDDAPDLRHLIMPVRLP
jgi:hypothetical protein